jgi:hypothetical protein
MGTRLLTLWLMLAGARGQGGCCNFCLSTCEMAGSTTAACLIANCATFCSPTACIAGQYKNFVFGMGWCACTDCPAGTYSGYYTPDGGCTSCPAGSYNYQAGAFACAFCPSGKYQPDSAQTTCLDCNAGTYGAGSQQRTACTTCSVGTYQPTSGYASCAPCQPGKYQPDSAQTACLDCKAGTSGAGFQVRTACTPCEAGTYQPTSGYASCDPCPPGKYQPDSAQTACLDCKAGTYGAGSQVRTACTTCSAGTYQPATGTTACINCNPASTCGSGTKAVPCPSNENTVCAPCSPPYTTQYAGQATCNACLAGHYYAFDQCNSCLTPTFGLSCTRDQYVTCPAYSTTHTCVYCTGSGLGGVAFCGIGQEQDKTCASGVDTTDAKCVDCGAGREKNSASSRACSPCSTGYYKSLGGPGACLACANKYAIGAAYIYRAETQSPDCQWECNAGYYRTGGTCIRCATLAGRYAPSSGQTACYECTNAPANSVYVAVSPGFVDVSSFDGTTNNCLWACNAGYGLQGSACGACPTGNYAGLRTVDGVTTRVCMPCRVCVAGTYESSQCASLADRGCTACSYVCAASQYITAQCNTTAPIQCRPCSARCPTGKYLDGSLCSGLTTSDTVLNMCLGCIGPESCQAGTQYLPSNCSGTERAPNTCAVCSMPACGFDTYRGGCGGYWDTQCLGYRACAGGQYLSGKQQDRDGVCKACRNCTLEGLPTILACSRYEDTVCGGTACNRSRPCASSNDAHFYCDYTGAPVCGRCPVRRPFELSLGRTRD